MQYKKGVGWKACYDEERDLYTAERSNRGYYKLCEIDKETFDKLGTEEVDDAAADMLIDKGRCMFEADDDYYTSMPTVAIRDEDYYELAPWADARRRAEKTKELRKKSWTAE